MTINTNQSFTIRNTTLKDIPIIFQFIKELAEYEKLLHEVVATEKILESNLFCKEPKAFALIAELNNKPIGFALYFYNFSTFLGKPGLYIEDLYIQENYRGHGYGKRLLAYLAKKAIGENCGRLEWWVLDWNETSIQFYKSIGAEPMNDWTVQRLSGNNLVTLASAYETLESSAG